MEQSWKGKNMENSHAIFEFYWQQVKAHYKENTQLDEDNQLKELIFVSKQNLWLYN